ncbi:MAG: mandelate racemase/muconate lactonizing enzyme family protein [Anaerolineae bacterium]|nr:mandelate racemase/muconate lactonizing enzyme family protein [Anaerolineae bacterium]
MGSSKHVVIKFERLPEQGEEMSIERIDSYYRDNVTVVKITASDGAVGYGQTAPFFADIAQIILHRQIAPLVLGEPDDDFNLATKVIVKLHKFTGSYVCRTVAGVDTALWDMKGKREGKSVADLVGKKQESIGMYGSSMLRNIPVEQEAERMVRLRDERGYTAFKLHVGVWNSEGEDYWPGRTEAMFELAHSALGDDVDLYVDPNGAFSREWTMALAPLMRDCNVVFLEEPLPFWKVEETASLRNAIAPFGILMAGGEQDMQMSSWQRILDLPMADIVQPDIGYIGGFTRALDVARKAAERGIFVTPHTANWSLLLPFGLHYMAVVDKPWPLLENSIEDDRWAKTMYAAGAEALTPVDGCIQVPDGPGWGMEISQDWLDSALHMESVIS